MEFMQPIYPPAEARAFPQFGSLPDEGYVRQRQLVRDPKRPEEPALLPFGPATLWRKVAAGTFPAPIKLSVRVTAWRVGDVRAWLQVQTTA